MISAIKVLWKSVKDIWEDMLLLVLMNLLTIVCGLPLFAALGIPVYLALLSTAPAPALIQALIIGLVLSIPASLPYAAAWFALNAVCNRVANGFAISWEFYFTNYKQSFIKAWVYMLFSNSVGILILVNFLWYPQAFPGQEWVPWMIGAWLAAGIFWTAIQFYAFPFYIEQELKSWRIAFKNAALVAGANPLFTLILLLVAAALLALSIGLLPPLFVLLGLLIWAMISTQGVVNRVAVYRARMATEEEKKTKSLHDARTH
ncbi:MAG: hypothetical protein M1434_04000 [Chloroflexi bacterium]|nr:hypothetical protein [Chloroflexota bacterium]MCL5273894.1 hypothetical protein [Chloroflexota bacterium]